MQEKVQKEETYARGKVFLGNRFLLTELSDPQNKNAIIQIPYITSSYNSTAVNSSLEELFFDYRLLNQIYFREKRYPFPTEDEIEKTSGASDLINPVVIETSIQAINKSLLEYFNDSYQKISDPFTKFFFKDFLIGAVAYIFKCWGLKSF